MVSNRVRIILIDDYAVEASAYLTRLNQHRMLNVELKFPPRDLNLGPVSSPLPDLFLVDFELTKIQPSGEYANYKGPTLAVALREIVEERPILLFTRKGLPSPDSIRLFVEKNEIFDDVVYKDDVDSDPDTVAELLRTIADGYRILRENPERTWMQLTSALGANQNEERLLREAVSPSPGWTVFEAARWIRHVILDYPGILYDPIYSSVSLGLSLDSFKSTNVQKIVGPARYTGLFAPPEGRWWRDRLFEEALKLMQQSETEGPINAGFAQAFQENFGEQLLPALSVNTGKPTANWVCYILNEPVKIEESLTYYPDQRPAVMDEARVSFKAIRESNNVEDELFDSESVDLIEKIREPI